MTLLLRCCSLLPGVATYLGFSSCCCWPCAWIGFLCWLCRLTLSTRHRSLHAYKNISNLEWHGREHGARGSRASDFNGRAVLRRERRKTGREASRLPPGPVATGETAHLLISDRSDGLFATLRCFLNSSDQEFLPFPSSERVFARFTFRVTPCVPPRPPAARPVPIVACRSMMNAW